MVVMHFICHMRNIRSMISDALKVIDRMQIQRNLCGLCRIHLALCKLDQVLTQTALIFVDQIFLTLNLIVFILLIIIQKIHRTVDVFTEFLGHSVHCTVTLCDCKRRIIDQTFLKKIKIRFIFKLFCTVLNQIANKLLEFRNKREQYYNRRHTEYGIQCCDRYRCHNHIHKSEMYKCIYNIEDH